MTDLERELRATAEAATPGPWTVTPPPWDRYGCTITTGRGDPHGEQVVAVTDGLCIPEAIDDEAGYRRAEDAEHIAAWHPARALAALDVIAAAREWKDAPLGERGDSSPEEIGALTKLFRAVQRWDETK